MTKMSFAFKYNYPQIARDSGFKLRQFRDGPIDWRVVGSLEVDRILREQQFEHIDAILFYLSEAPLASILESNVLDSGISKYFILSQLAIQYLVFCRKFLDETVRTLRESLVEAQTENVNLTRANQDHSNEIVQLHKKLSQIEAISDIVFPCHMCTKNFVSNEALNVHLSKKHPKSPSIDGRDNDRTLINTIKLELEIKQLKERLNAAEKDIRETVESRKPSPREVHKTSSSTQINTATNNVGTQSNLSEEKESDCVEYENAKKLEVLSQLQEKISNLESWQESQRTANLESIGNITQKLSEITESLQSKAELDAENIKKLTKDALAASISSKQIIPAASAEELQTILSNTVSEALHQNSEKLSEILTKIDTIYEKKLPSLEDEIHRGAFLAQEQIKGVLSLPKALTQPLADKYSSASQSRGTFNIEKPPLMVTAKTASQGTFSVEKEKPKRIDIGDSGSDGDSTDVSQELLESEGENVESVGRSTDTEEVSFRTIAKEAFERKMEKLGVSPSAKAISMQELDKMSAHLAESRSSLKTIYPRFYATRNKFKKLVERLSLKKQAGTSHRNESSKPKATKTKQKADRSTVPTDDTDSFKQRLDRILSSPIKKPTAYVPRHTKEPMKPVPMPRKRVMFYTERSSGDEASVSASKSPSTKN